MNPGAHAAESFEAILTGGHHNSLGRTEELVAMILEDRDRLDELMRCYSSSDETVRLRVSSALKRVTIEQPDWTMDFMDVLHGDVADLDQASAQWTLPLVFDLTKDRQTAEQLERSVAIMKRNLAEHDDWIVLNNTMQVLSQWSLQDPELSNWLVPHLERLTGDRRKSVAGRAKKHLTELAEGSPSPGG